MWPSGTPMSGISSARPGGVIFLGSLSPMCSFVEIDLSYGRSSTPLIMYLAYVELTGVPPDRGAGIVCGSMFSCRPPVKTWLLGVPS